MKKIFVGIISVVVCLGVFFCSGSVLAAIDTDVYDVQEVTKMVGKVNVNELNAKSAILIDSQYGNVLFEKNCHEKLPIASVTKIMSMLLVMDAVKDGKLKFDDAVQVSEYAAGMGGSQAYLKPGEEFTVRDMMKAVAVHSSNDVTVSLAEKVEGSEAAFVARMNEKAQELGMKDTLFTDCTGLEDDTSHSSACDVALMSRYLMNTHPDIVQFTSIWHDTFRDGKFSLDNTNKLLKFYSGTDGIKTGYTSKAGYCLSATATRNGFRLISVILGEPDTNTRFAESRALLDYGFINYEYVTVNKKNERLTDITIKKGIQPKVGVVYKDDVKIPVMRSEKGKIARSENLNKLVVAPIKKGQKLGEVTYKIGDKTIGTVDVVAEDNVGKASFVRLFVRMILGWVGINKV